MKRDEEKVTNQQTKPRACMEREGREGYQAPEDPFAVVAPMKT